MNYAKARKLMTQDAAYTGTSKKRKTNRMKAAEKGKKKNKNKNKYK